MTWYEFFSIVIALVGVLVSLGVFTKVWTIANMVGKWEQWMISIERELARMDKEISSHGSLLQQLEAKVSRILGRSDAEWDGLERRKP